MEHGSSVVECRTRYRENPGSNIPIATVSNFGHFRSLHDAPVHCLLPRETELVSE